MEIKQKLENAKTYTDIRKVLKDSERSDVKELFETFLAFKKFSELTLRDEAIMSCAKERLVYGF